MQQISSLLPTVSLNMEMPMVVLQPSTSTIGEYARQVMEETQKLDAVMESILGGKDEVDPQALANCNDFLMSLLKQPEHDSKAMNDCVRAFISKLPQTTFYKLLTDYPALSLNLLECCDYKTSAFVFTYLIYINPEWKLILGQIFHSLDKSVTEPSGSLKQTQAGKFLSLILTHIPHRNCKQWLKFCVKNLTQENLIFFVLVLDQQRRFILNFFIATHQLNLTQKGLGPFIQGIVQQKNSPDVVDIVLNQILDKFYRRKTFKRFVDQFNRLNSDAQICFLTLMSVSKKEMIFKKYCGHLSFMVSFVDGLFKHQPDFFQRQYNINHILNCIGKEKVNDFLSLLDKQESPITPYLLICFSEEIVKDFICQFPLDLRSRLLSHGIADSTTYQLLEALVKMPERHHLIQLMGIRIEHFSVDPMESLTLGNCIEVLQQVVKNKEMWETYASFLTSIPPFLIGILTMNSNHRGLFLNLINLLSDEQLKFLVVTLPPETIGAVFERFESSLKPKHLMEILEILSEEQLQCYVTSKIQKMKEYYDQFLIGDKELQEQLYQIKDGELITYTYYVELEKKKDTLFKLLQRPVSMDCQCLARFLKQSQATKKIPELFLKWNQITTQLTSKRTWFEGPHAFMTITFQQLEKIVKDWPQDEEIDLTQTLYTEFWLLVREKTLPYLGISQHSPLGITHPGELTLLGIQTNEDLEFLGISAQAQRAVEELIQKLTSSLDMLPDDNFKKLWQIFIDICDDKLDPMDAEKKHKVDSKRITQELHLAKQDPSKVRKNCFFLCQELLRFKNVSKQERDILEQGSKKLENCHDSEVLKISESLFEQAFGILKNQYPIFCLQRYLCKNTHLKQAWEKFRSLGCQSISLLVGKKIVQQPSDLLCLADIASKL